jgi:phage tail sheath protein FI
VLNWQGDVGDVVAMGADTLSKDPKFRNYTIKRTYDYIYKTMRNYLNQQVYKGFDDKLKKSIDGDLNKFLSLLQRNKVINGFTCNVIATNEMIENQQMLLEVALNTKTPIKQYVVKLEALVDESGQAAVK